ncbi:ParA family protein [Ruminiclostridium josui]|uniref:ParA family protein n=1 Tax=Ruminiclostridium josui TaxID=1499 RepID=UPI00046683EF|nr:ParA family protein [Ruminiclostridium josui]
MQVISIMSFKGGVAKTITAICLAYILSVVFKFRVLIIDNDKQGNATKSFELHSEERKSISDLLIERNINIHDVILPTKYENLHLIPANMKLVEANMKMLLNMTGNRDKRLATALDEIQDEYDFCIIDNAPDLNMSTQNALVATDEVIIPVKMDKYSFDGINELTEQIEFTKEDSNPKLRIGGYLITQFYNSEYTKNKEEELRNSYKYPVYKTRIRRTPKVDESTDHDMPILEYSRTCSASRDYLDFAKELLS